MLIKTFLSFYYHIYSSNIWTYAKDGICQLKCWLKFISGLNQLILAHKDFLRKKIRAFGLFWFFLLNCLQCLWSDRGFTGGPATILDLFLICHHCLCNTSFSFPKYLYIISSVSYRRVFNFTSLIFYHQYSGMGIE